MEKGNSFDIKQKNRKRIYDFIRNNGSVSKQDIVYGLQLSLPTVTQNLQYFTKQGLIHTNKKIKNTGGRDATAYTYIPDVKVAVGVDITGHHIKCVVVDLCGKVLHVISKRRVFARNDAYFKCVGSIVDEVLEEAGISEDRVLGVGIAVPGLVSDDGEEVTYGITLNFSGEKRSNFAKYISLPNRLYHDSHAAGYAEVWSRPEIKDAFYLNLGNSVGGSILIDNKVFVGNTHKSGEIGHLTIVPDGEVCYCGQRGCFETCCNALLLSNYGDGNLGTFFKLLDDNDEGAKKIWDQYLEYLSIAIKDIRMLFDTEIIVGGYVGAYMENRMEKLEELVDAKNLFHDHASEFLFPCNYKIEAIAAGAAIMYVDTYINNI
ncbi:MAG: ROK family protein [Lachnospiraceae bacterium]|nr:ROK family protein [Lachnospiraceae bacterium]